MVTLNVYEMRVYNKMVHDVIPGLAPGKYKVRDFLPGSVGVARIARRFYEEVTAGYISNVSLIGTKSSDGYLIR